MNEFSISVRNMDCFLTHKQCAKEVEVEELHNIEYECEHSSSMKNKTIGAHGCQQRMERCPVLTAKSLMKQAETSSSQVVS